MAFKLEPEMDMSPDRQMYYRRSLSFLRLIITPLLDISLKLLSIATISTTN